MIYWRLSVIKLLSNTFSVFKAKSVVYFCYNFFLVATSIICVYQAILHLNQRNIWLLGVIAIVYGMCDYAAVEIELENASEETTISLDTTEAPVLFAIATLGVNGLLPVAAASLFMMIVVFRTSFMIAVRSTANRLITYILWLGIYSCFPVSLIPFSSLTGVASLFLLMIIGPPIAVLVVVIQIWMRTGNPIRRVLRSQLTPTMWVSSVPIALGGISASLWTIYPALVLPLIILLYLAHRALKAITSYVEESAKTRRLARDLQQTKEMLEERVQERTAALVRSEANREREVADAVHDLRHELRTIKAAVLEGTPSFENNNSLFESANDLLTDMLLASQLRGDALQLNPAVTDIGSLAADVLRQLNPVFQQADCILRIDVPDEPVFAWCDGLRINRVLKNIIHNALVYTLNYRAQARISVVLTASDTLILCSVIDNGPGMSDDEIQRLGERFLRLKTGDERPDGVGIGLSFCARLLALSNGSLSITSDGPGRGTVVTVALPRVFEVEQHEHECDDDNTSEQSAELAHLGAGG